MSDAQPALPANWQCLRTDDGREYFWNTETNETTFVNPALSSDLPDGWAAHVAGDGRVYYEHKGKGVTQWEHPAESKSRSSKTDESLPEGWRVATTPEGREYFWNVETDETTFERPSASGGPRKLPEGWVAHTAGDGRKYYENASTGQTQWEFPAEASKTEVEATKTEVEASKTEVEATKTEVEATKTEVEATKTEVEATKTEVEASVPSMAGDSASSASAASAIIEETQSGGTWKYLPPPTFRAGPIDAVVGEEPWTSKRELVDQLLYFDDIDVDRTGFVTADLMRRFSDQQGLNLEDEGIQAALEGQDFDGDNRVSIREFLAAIGRPAPVTEAFLYDALYDRFVADPVDGATPIELRKVLDTLETEYTEETVAHWMRHPDSKVVDGMRRLPRQAFIQVWLPPSDGDT
jgi:hypothetical protein